MMDILALLQCINPTLSKTNLRRVSRIVFALLAMTGRVSMLGISRWAGKGGSYRTVQRLFNEEIAWAQVFWQFFRQHLYQDDAEYILPGSLIPREPPRLHTTINLPMDMLGFEEFFKPLLSKLTAYTGTFHSPKWTGQVIDQWIVYPDIPSFNFFHISLHLFRIAGEQGRPQTML